LNLVDAIILGLLQGVAEFLPISSSGHLTLAQAILKLKEAPLTLNLALHVATLVVIVIFYRKKIKKLLFPLQMDYLKAIIICSIPTAIIGLGIKKLGDQLFQEGLWSAIFLSCNGLFLLLLNFRLKKTETLSQAELMDPPSSKQALIIGFAQGIAALPGISRSGSTIGCACLLGVRPAMAAEFSLLASLPVILGAALLEAKDFSSFSNPSLVGISFIITLISGWISIGLLLKIVKKAAWKWWGIYCLVTSALYLSLYAL
jgi:undecaprenyl-diphosphatase